LLDPPTAQAAEAHVFRRLRLTGRYAADRQFLLDGMTHDGTAGYHVLTPFRPQNSERWLLVNRGWIEANPDRSVLPEVVVDEELRTIEGRIARLPRPGIRLGDARAPDLPPAAVTVVLYPTVDELAAHLSRPVHDYQLLLDARGPHGFERDWELPQGGVWRHRAYALQWLLFAVVLAALSYRVWRRQEER
jgi:surfeit locus 1 family protein